MTTEKRQDLNTFEITYLDLEGVKQKVQIQGMLKEFAINVFTSRYENKHRQFISCELISKAK